MSTTRALDQLQQVHELNRVFLGLLQDAGPRPARVLRAAARRRPRRSPIAPSRPLDGVAGFPRALFLRRRRLAFAAGMREADADFDEARARSLPVDPVRGSAHEPAQRVSGAVAVRSRSRGRRAAGRRAAARLAAARLRAGRAASAHSASGHWFWHGLFTATRPELRRQLALMALQPASRSAGRSAGRRNRPPEAAAPFVAPRVAALTIAALGARAPRAGNHGRVSHQGSSEGLSQRRRGAEGHRPHGARRRFFRAARAERRRQDHGHRHRDVADSQVRRLGDGVRPRSRARARGGESLHRRRAARDQLEHVRAQRSHARQPGRLLRRPARRRAGAHRKVSEGAAPLGQTRRDRAPTVGRHEAPAHDCARPRARAAAPDPRRADGRRRHRDPPLDVGVHARDQRQGHDDHLDDALSGGSGKPLPQHRDHRRRPHHRERQHGQRHRQAAARSVRAELAGGRSASRRRSPATRYACATRGRSRSRWRRGRD